MQFFRKIVFYVCTAIYLVVCPVLILYAVGYFYEPGVAGGVVKTGLISLATAPSGAGVYINGKQYAKKTPTLIRELLPKSYDVTIRLPGYDEWRKTVRVREEKAAVFDKVILMPSKRSEKEISSGGYRDLIELPGTEIILLDGGAGLGSINVYNVSNGKEWPLADPKSPFARYAPISLVTTDNDDSFILLSSLESETKYLWIETQTDDNVITDITPYFKGSPSYVEWAQGDKRYIFSLHNETLTRTDVENAAEYPEYVKDVKGCGLFGSEIYVLKKDNTLEKMNLDKSNLSVILDDPQVGDLAFKSAGFYKIEILSAETILFLSDSGALSANRLPYKFADKGVLGIKPDDGKKKILFWTTDKIGIIDFSAEATGNVEFEKGPSLTWVYTAGKKISQVYWVYDGSHLLFRDGGDIFLISLDPEGDHAVQDVLKMKDARDVFYSENTGKLYLIPVDKGPLFETGIVPEKEEGRG